VSSVSVTKPCANPPASKYHPVSADSTTLSIGRNSVTPDAHIDNDVEYPALQTLNEPALGLWRALEMQTAKRTYDIGDL
jgi:hypothetical protein